MKQYIYADNAATTKLDMDAFEAMKPYLLGEYGNASQPYSFSRTTNNALENARQTIASCINAQPDEIFFTSGGTESDNWAIKSIIFSNDARKETITSAFEHHAILHSCKTIEHIGFPVSYLQPTPEGKITLAALQSCITDRTKLVSIMFANNELGSIQPIKELCNITHAHGALFHTDAVQAMGHIPINVNDLGVDMLSASAHKFNGPKGIGFMFLRKGTELSAYIDGGTQERGYRAGTENIASIVGMAVALKNNCDALIENQNHVSTLKELLINQLNSYGFKYTQNGGMNTLPGILSLSFPGKDGEAILHRMDLMGISISTGSACDSKNTNISHVLRAIGLEKSLAEGTIRISLGKNNSQDEIKIISEALKKICSLE